MNSREELTIGDGIKELIFSCNTHTHTQQNSNWPVCMRLLLYLSVRACARRTGICVNMSERWCFFFFFFLVCSVLFSLSILDCCPPHLYTFIRIFINYAFCFILFRFNILKPLFIIRIVVGIVVDSRLLRRKKRVGE